MYFFNRKPNEDKKKFPSSLRFVVAVCVCVCDTEKGSTVCNDEHCNNGITDVSLQWKMYGLKPIKMPVKMERKNVKQMNKSKRKRN